MLTCVPSSLFTWNYRVEGTAVGEAHVLFNWATEQGRIVLGATELTIRKHGWLSGKWSVQSGAQTLAWAIKPSAMLRMFELTAGDAQYVARAQSPFTRSYDILQAQRVVGAIRPAHPFTRRAIIDCDASVPELVQLLAFWFAALTWRRAAESN